MFKRTRKAFDIMRACWKVLQLDKELLVFPLFSVLILGALVGFVVWPFWAAGIFPEFLLEPDETGEPSFNEILIGVVVFTAYFVTYFTIIFFNSALIACVKIRFAGGDPVVMDGLRASIAKLPQIFIWALFSAVIGFILDQLRNKEGGPLAFVVAMLGLGWAVAVYFVVPVLVSENIGPIAAIKKSVKILKKTWGETLVAEVGFGVLYSAIGFVIVGSAIASAFLFDAYPAISITIIGVGILSVVFMTLVFTTLGAILKAALYVYAVDGKLPDAFDPDLIKGAFKSN